MRAFTEHHVSKTLRWVVNFVLALGLIFADRTAIAQVVTTFAGSGERGDADGMGTTASFSAPLGLAVDPSGTLYVADTESLKIRKITTDGLVTTFAGNGLPGYDAGPGASARFFGPLNVAVDPSGNLWVADQEDIFDVDGQYLKRITPAGFVQNLLLYPGVQPSVLAVDKDGALYVSDLFKGLWKIRTDLKSASQISPRAPQGMALDRAGNAYLAYGNRIDRIGFDEGFITHFAGSDTPGSADGTGTSASFRDARGLAVDQQGKVYVADRGNHKIRMITPDGNVTTLAGSGSPGRADGAPTEASFNHPASVAVDFLGNVYVADSGNNSIRKISAGTSCTGDPAALCLNAGHQFRVTLSAHDGRTGRDAFGVAVRANEAFGYFTIPDLTFDAQSPEVFVKMVDGRDLNGSFWVFYGGLTDLGYTLQIQEQGSGRIRTYVKPAGSACGGIDTSAF